jgi:ATP-binding cassette subfamily B protein
MLFNYTGRAMKKINTEMTIQRRQKIFIRMMREAWQLRPLAVLLFITGAVIEAGGSISAIYTGARLSALLAEFAVTGTSEEIWLWFWLTIVASIITGLGFLMMAYAKRILYYSFVRWSINGFLSNLAKIEFAEFYNDETRNLINKVGGSYSWQIANLSDINLDLIYGIVRFIAITAVVSQIAWWVAPIIAIFLVPTLLTDAKISKLQWFVWDQKGDERHVFWGLEYILRQAKGQMELRSLQAENYILGRIDSMNNAFYGKQEEEYRKARTPLIIAQILEGIGPAIAGIVVLKQFLTKTISLERYFFITGALVRIAGAINSIFGTLTRMQEPIILADNYLKLLEQTPKVTDPKSAKKLVSKDTPSIVFEDLSFTYPGQDTPVFNNLNLAIKSGEHIALVGENGAGKSTLIKLLLRFYKPTSGKILINGVDLQELSIESWYDQIATLFQDFNQYPLTVAENISIGRSSKKTNQKLLEQAGDFGGISPIVKNYKHGWETVLDSSFKKGTEPSGGQWQRVAISRAFYRQANILILDEPTSAIDAKAEYEIFNNIFNHYKNKSALIVSHRFSTVRRADRIVVLDQGKIVEQGSHQMLMKKSGLYHDLFTKQAAGYKE